MKFPKLKAQYGVLQTPTQPYNVLGGIPSFVPGQLEGDGFRFTTGQKHPYFTPMPDESQFTTEIHGGGGDPGYTLDEIDGKQFIVMPEQTDKPLSFSDSRVVDKGSGAMLGQPPITFPFSGSQNIPMVGNVQYKGEAPMPDIGPDDLTQEQYDAFDPRIGKEVDYSQPGLTDPRLTQDPYSSLVSDYETKMEDIGSKYFNRQRAYGVSSLIHNILQPEPPSRVSKNVYLDRFRMDERPFKVAAAQQQEMATKANAASRRIGQLSDAMKFQQASQATSQEQARGLATAYSQAKQQVDAMNTQTAQKKDMVNTEIINRDIDFNLRKSDAHYKHKADAISKSLAMLSQTEGHQARFDASAIQSMTQTKMLLQHREDQARLDKAALMLQHSKGWRDSDTYKTALAAEVRKYGEEHKQEIIDQDLIPYEGDITKLQSQIEIGKYYLDGLEKEANAVLPTEPKAYTDDEIAALTPEQKEDWQEKKRAYDKAAKDKTTRSTEYIAARDKYNANLADYNKKKEGQEKLRELWNNSGLLESFEKSFKEKYGYVDLKDISHTLPNIYRI